MKRNILFFLWLMLASGCGDSFLELDPISNSNANNFYTTRKDFDLAVNNAYATLYTIYAPQSAVSYFAEQMSDNATLYNVAGAQADRWAFKDHDLRPSNTEVYRFWQEYYNALYSINIVLEKVETAEIEDRYRQLVKAEMMFLRGLYYFHMVQMWGAVPLVDRPLTAEESYDILRAPVPEIYEFILSDLQFAEVHLPPASEVSLPGKASRGAARTLLGKVYLTMGDKAAAAQVLLEVYNSGHYALLPEYRSLWEVDNKNTPESIFEIQYLGGAGNPYSRYWTEFAPTENFSITVYGGGMNQVTEDLWNAYEPGDIRRDLSVFTGYTNQTGTFIPIKFPKKWVDTAAQVVDGRELSNNNFIVFRYSDVLLLLSEATGDPIYLNQVRDRVGLPTFGSPGYPSDEFPTLELAIEHERRVELALEFHRLFDLKRNRRAVPVLTDKGKSVTAEKLLLPIPEIVRQQNSVITQNDAY